MKKKVLLVGLILLLLFTTACGNQKKNTVADNGLTIYTTVYPLTYFTERIGGEHVNVTSIYPAGSNEHTFEPTQKDMIALADSTIFFYIGLGLEGFVDKAKETLKNENVKMVATADAVPNDKLEMHVGDEEDHHDEATHDGHNHGGTDPHIWISPTLSQYIALSIKDTLVEADPAHEAEYTTNFQTLVTELDDLDRQFKDMANKAKKKTFFVSHAAFGYLSAPYGLEQVAIAGLNSQDEPSQQELTKIVDEARKHDVKYILFEQNVSSKTTEIIRKEIGAEALVMHNLGVLTNEDIQNNETYFTLMERNLETLKTALNE